MKNIDEDMTERIKKSGTKDEFQFAAFGYTIHNLYNAFESYFFRIAKFFENEIYQHEWHSSLVERMRGFVYDIVTQESK